MTDRELMQMALEAVEYFYGGGQTQVNGLKLIEALRDRLAQPEHEWVGLTDGETNQAIAESIKRYGTETWMVAKSIEAKLKEKNT